MREIKVRAWHPKWNVFIYFDTLDMIHSSGYAVEAGEIKNKTPYHYWDTPAPIQQYTGIKDLDGVEIYEGDIVKSTLAGIGNRFVNEVVFEDGCFVFGKGGFPIKNYITETSGFKVIGNIFLNSELLNCAYTSKIQEVNEQSDEDDLSDCEQCNEKAWDGRICHACGMELI